MRTTPQNEEGANSSSSTDGQMQRAVEEEQRPEEEEEERQCPGTPLPKGARFYMPDGSTVPARGASEEEEEEVKELEEGERVMLRRLKAKSELNGEAGKLGKWGEESGRWRVLLDSGLIVNAFPRNLERQREERKMQIPKLPLRPSPEKVRAHRAGGHRVYANWCRSCVQGCKRDLPHSLKKGRSQERVTEFNLDYFFPRDSRGEAHVQCLAIKHVPSKTLGTMMVSTKGGGDRRTVERVLKFIRRCGEYGKVLLKSDQEFPIVDLLEAVAQGRGASETLIENAPRGDSKSNGGAERAVQSIEETVRVGLLDLEEETKTKF